MKTYGKRILTVLLTLALIISVVPNMAYAADITSGTDNNDTSSTATPLSSAGTVTGVLSSEDDVDFYKYTVDVTGYYNFTLRDTTESGKQWKLSVYDSSMNELDSEINKEYTLTTNTYDFKKGDELYLKVTDRTYSTGKEYSLSVNATTASDWEQEHNDTKSNATIIKANSPIFGNLYLDEDVDFYKYTVDVTGYYSFTLKDTTESGKQWKLSVYDSSLNELESEINEEYTLTTKTYNFKKGTILYLKVKDRTYSMGMEYSLTVNAKENANWEQESNDSFRKASSLKSNTTKYGNLYFEDDVDYYSYTAVKSGTLKTMFKLDVNDVGGWEIIIYDSSKKEIKEVTNITSDKTISFKGVKGNKYYMLVRADRSYSSPINITYTFKIK